MYKQIEQDKVFNFLNKIVEMVESFREEVASTSTETVEETTATVGETEIIEHEGLKLKRVDREAREGDYIQTSVAVGGLKKNKIYGPAKVSIFDSELVVNNGSYVYWKERTPSTVEVYEVIDVLDEKLPFPEVELTANQKRAKLIEQAKKFVEVKSEYLKNSTEVIGGYERKEKENPNFCGFIMKAEFIANSEKRTVVCLLKFSNDNDIESRGIAKCAPGDVFNEHIGQAIALARALEIEVPEEFLKAVQPDEVVVGMKVCGKNLIKIYEVTAFHQEEKLGGKYGRSIAINGVNNPEWVGTKQVTIIDDTNAKYKDI